MAATVTKRYGRVFAALVIVTLLLVTPAAAEVCWGKICSSDEAKLGLCATCCGGHGSCVAFNTCSCDDGFTGKECETPIFCGYASSGPVCRGDFQSACNSPGGFCSVNEMNSTLLMTASCLCNYNRTGTCCDQYRQGRMRPSAIDFGTTTVGGVAGQPVTVTYDTPFTASSFQVRNMAVTAITITGTNSDDFSLGTGTCSAGSDVAADGNCTVSITFTPAAAGARTATLALSTVDPDDAANTQVLNTTLTGTGTITVSSILVDSAVPSRIYAGIDGAGIYRSTNSGGSWSAATLAPVTVRVRALTMKPGDSSKLFAGTYGSGVYKSTDTGATWSACTNTGLANQNVLSIVSNPSGGLFAGTESGVYTSGDCNTWTALNNGLP
jgi:hypothetical protein